MCSGASRPHGKTEATMSSEQRLFFATDLHGSERCFRKFLGAARFYGASTLFMGGDFTGKGIVPIWKLRSGRWQTRLDASIVDISTEAELVSCKRVIADRGLYALETTEDEFSRLTDRQKNDLLIALASERLTEWLEMVSQHAEYFRTVWTPGNDDPTELDYI